MTSRWSFFAFDWDRYRAAEAALEYACSTGDFTSLEIEGAEQSLARFDSNTEPAVISNTLVAELFGVGEAVIFESGLLETVRGIRKRPNGEGVADILSELLSAEPNIEPWFRAEEGLVGLLTEAQTRSLVREIKSFRPGFHPARPRGVAAITKIFSASDQATDRLDDLMDLVNKAATDNHGIGVLREG